MERLKISRNNRHFVTESEKDFFWLADTAWELVHALKIEEIEDYFRTRIRQGFNVVQTVILAEHHGLDHPNAYGQFPLLKNDCGQYDPTLPDDSPKNKNTYWKHLDQIIQIADEMGLYLALLPTWGDKYNQMWGVGPEIFNQDNAYEYGKWLGKRYRKYPNIIWVLGGDRPLKTRKHFDIICGMARGIKAEDPNHLMTFHPVGPGASAEQLHDEEWLDFNMIQSGHAKPYLENYKMIERDYKRFPVKPVLEAESRYEDAAVNFLPENGYFDDFDVRTAAYWSVFSGGCGFTYGNHCVWRMNQQRSKDFIMPWSEALERPGANQMVFLKQLMFELDLDTLEPCNEIIAEQQINANYIACIKSNSKILAYIPNGLPFSLCLQTISMDKNGVHWRNPRNGEVLSDKSMIRRDDMYTFCPPTCGRGHDWILEIRYNPSNN